MDEGQRELVNYFIAETNKKFEQLEKKVDEALKFKHEQQGRAAGISTLVSFLTTIVFQVAALLFGK